MNKKKIINFIGKIIAGISILLFLTIIRQNDLPLNLNKNAIIPIAIIILILGIKLIRYNKKEKINNQEYNNTKTNLSSSGKRKKEKFIKDIIDSDTIYFLADKDGNGAYVESNSENTKGQNPVVHLLRSNEGLSKQAIKYSFPSLKIGTIDLETFLEVLEIFYKSQSFIGTNLIAPEFIGPEINPLELKKEILTIINKDSSKDNNLNTKEDKKQKDDLKIIKSLKQHGSDMKKKHKIEHHFISKNKDNLTKLYNHTKKTKYKTSDIIKNGKEIFFDIIIETIPNIKNISKDTTQMIKLAEKYNCLYDGRGTGIVK